MGFDIECIPNSHWLSGECFCPVCHLLVYPNEALQSMCTHLYCKPCLAYVARTTRACPYDGCLVTETDAKPLMESNEMLAYAIGQTVVYCLYKKSGCTWVGSLADSSVHCSGCAFGSSRYVCDICGILMEHRRAHEHFQVCQGDQPIDASDQVQAPIQANVVAVAQGTCQASATLNQPIGASGQVQASAQGHGAAIATLTQQQDYRGYYMHPQHYPMSSTPQEKLHPPSQHASPYQSLSVHPTFQYLSQTQSQLDRTKPVGVPSNSMLLYHQAGPQHVQVQNHLPHLQVPMQMHPTATEYAKLLARKYGGASASPRSAMHPAHQALSKHSLPQQHTMAQTTVVVRDGTRTDFGQGQEPGRLISKYTGKFSHGLGGDFPERVVEGRGNLHIGKRLRGSDMINSNIRGDCSSYHSNALRPGDIKLSYTGDVVGPFHDSRDRRERADAWCRICKLDCVTSQGLDLHFRTKEHHQKTIEMALMIQRDGKKLKTAHANSSPFMD